MDLTTIDSFSTNKTYSQMPFSLDKQLLTAAASFGERTHALLWATINERLSLRPSLVGPTDKCMGKKHLWLQSKPFGDDFFWLEQLSRKIRRWSLIPQSSEDTWIWGMNWVQTWHKNQETTAHGWPWLFRFVSNLDEMNIIMLKTLSSVRFQSQPKASHAARLVPGPGESFFFPKGPCDRLLT